MDIYARGVCAMSVCVSADATQEQIEKAANCLNPTGIASRWAISKAKAFKDGTPHPKPCERQATRLHYLLEC